MTAGSGSTTSSTGVVPGAPTCWRGRPTGWASRTGAPALHRRGGRIGTIDGRRVRVPQDFTVFGDALGEVFAEKIHKVIDLAASTRGAHDRLNDGAGPGSGGRGSLHS